MADTPPCRSDYYTDTDTKPTPDWSRVIRCGLPKHGRDTDHAEIDDAGEVMHTWAWAPEPQPQPRTWEMTPEPGPEVTKVRCHCHGVWERGEVVSWLGYLGHLWLNDVDRVTMWPDLLVAHTAAGHPLTDATHEEGDI